jgi:DNA invertase Pin-like site-specific DNA recombinase
MPKPIVQTCALYARVSTTKQDNENQLAALRTFARRQGWKVVAEYVETVTGSGKKARAEFDRMMLAASQRQFDVLVFWALDRLSRDERVSNSLRHLEQLDQWGVKWRSYTEPHLDTSNELVRDILLSVFASIAKAERKRISERTKAGMATARKRGAQIGRPAVTVDVARARKLKRQGLSLRAIAAQLGLASHGPVARVLGGVQ